MVNPAPRPVKIVSAEDYTLSQLLHNRYPLVVPPYQRAYAWAEDEVGDFCDDLGNLLRAANPDAYHFFGGMVTVHEIVAGQPGWNHSYEVVDGQQRVATFGMALAAVVSELRWLSGAAAAQGVSDVATEAAAHAQWVYKNQLTFESIENGDLKENWRIMLSGVDREVYSSLLGNPTRDPIVNSNRESHRLLVTAARKALTFVQCYSRAEGKTLRERLELVKSFETSLLHQCLLVHIMTTNRQAARQLFSVLNNRGKSLGAGDLLRSATLELVWDSPQQAKRVEKAWDNIIVESESRIDSFLMAVHASHQGRRPRQYALFEDFRSAYFPDGVTAQDYATRAERLQGEAALYRTLGQGEWPFSTSEPKIKDWDRARLKHLVKTLDNTLCLTILMAAASHLSQLDFAQIVNLLERITFRYVTMVGAHVTALSNLYARQAQQIRIRQKNYQMSQLTAELTILVNERANDDLFKEAMRSKLVYARNRNLHIRYYLSVLEHYWDYCLNPTPAQRMADRTLLLNLDELTLEHIYPQNAGVKDVDLELTLNHLGNLTILAPGENTRLGNMAFVDKKPEFSAGRFKINHAIGSLPTWDKAQFEARQERLLEYGIRVFAVWL